MKSKGITDIIAIVLLLMITISMVGFAWLWLQRMTASSMNKSSEQIEQFSSTAGQVAVIDALDKTGSRVYIRNVGSATIPQSNIQVYAAGASITCTWTPNVNISVGSTVACGNAAIGTCAAGNIIKITTPGGEDTIDC